jgi:hypothetical protein
VVVEVVPISAFLDQAGASKKTQKATTVKSRARVKSLPHSVKSLSENVIFASKTDLFPIPLFSAVEIISWE